MKSEYIDVNGEPVEVPNAVGNDLVVCHDGTVLVSVDGVVRPVLASRVGDKTWLTQGTSTTWIQRVHKRRGGGDQDAGSTVAAPMTGRVVVVSVAVGDEVVRGDTVVVIEAMKMEQPLKAPRDGVVEVVRCETGQLVDGGDVLVALAKEAS
jgi:biotin carboxyl carrier protein